MPKPTQKLDWATTPNAESTPFDPGGTYKAIGFRRGFRVAAGVLNWALNRVDSWITYLDTFEGEPHTWTANQTVNATLTVGVSQLLQVPSPESIRYTNFAARVNLKANALSTQWVVLGNWVVVTNAGSGTRFLSVLIDTPINRKLKSVSFQLERSNSTVPVTVQLVRTDSSTVTAVTLATTSPGPGPNAVLFGQLNVATIDQIVENDFQKTRLDISVSQTAGEVVTLHSLVVNFE